MPLMLILKVLMASSISVPETLWRLALDISIVPFPLSLWGTGTQGECPAQCLPEFAIFPSIILLVHMPLAQIHGAYVAPFRAATLWLR
jgi:hypothetical protein